MSCRFYFYRFIQCVFIGLYFYRMFPRCVLCTTLAKYFFFHSLARVDKTNHQVMVTIGRKVNSGVHEFCLNKTSIKSNKSVEFSKWIWSSKKAWLLIPSFAIHSTFLFPLFFRRKENNQNPWFKVMPFWSINGYKYLELKKKNSF